MHPPRHLETLLQHPPILCSAKGSGPHQRTSPLCLQTTLRSARAAQRWRAAPNSTNTCNPPREARRGFHARRMNHEQTLATFAAAPGHIVTRVGCALRLLPGTQLHGRRAAFVGLRSRSPAAGPQRSRRRYTRLSGVASSPICQPLRSLRACTAKRSAGSAKPAACSSAVHSCGQPTARASAHEPCPIPTALLPQQALVPRSRMQHRVSQR
jgi:hypothetical protein